MFNFYKFLSAKTILEEINPPRTICPVFDLKERRYCKGTVKL